MVYARKRWKTARMWTVELPPAAAKALLNQGLAKPKPKRKFRRFAKRY